LVGVQDWGIIIIVDSWSAINRWRWQWEGEGERHETINMMCVGGDLVLVAKEEAQAQG
jgi:hypothetical protein